MNSPHLLLDLSAHGFGHIAQAAPVVNELRTRIPRLRLTVRSAVPRALLETRFGPDFAHVPEVLDFGFLMKNAIDVDVEQSRAAYRQFHLDFDGRVDREAAKIRHLQPDLVLANVPYVSLAAAARAGIPSVGFCSLNWAELYRHICCAAGGADAIFDEILGAYNSASRFLALEPGMPMTGISRRSPVGPVCTPGRNRRAELADRLGLRAGERIGLISMGGMPFPVDFRKWPRTRGVRWLVSGAENAGHPDFIEFEPLAMPFADILASCDLMVTKPGYGSFVEAACSGVAVLYVDRKGWLEAPYLISWLRQNGNCLEIKRDEFQQGAIMTAVETLLAMPQRPPAVPTGAAEAVDQIRRLLT